MAVTLAVAHSPFGLGKSSSSSCLAVFFSDSPFCELLKTATTIKKCTRRVEGDREENKENKGNKEAAGQWRINWPIGKLRLCSTCRQNLPTCLALPEQQDDLRPVPFVLLFGKIGNRSRQLLRFRFRFRLRLTLSHGSVHCELNKAQFYIPCNIQQRTL